MRRAFASTFCLYFFVFFALFAQPLQISTAAKAAVLINNKNGLILYEKHADEKIFPASITKIATAYYILEKYPHLLKKNCLVSSDAITTVSSRRKASNDYQTYPSFILESDGSTVDLKRGEAIDLLSLLYAVLLASGNDAANVVAESVDKNISAFMLHLNDFLKEKGCKNTNFCNPHGLHHPEHTTTASDIAKLTTCALNNPYFSKIVGTEKYKLPASNKQQEREIKQTNRLLKKEMKEFYPYALGVKTGYTSFAGYNLVAAAEKNGRSLTVVLLGYESSDNRYRDAKRLFEAAFKEKKIKKRILKKEKHFAIQIEGATDILEATLKNDLFLEYYPSEEVPYKAYVYWNDLNLPIAKDCIVGKVKLVTEDGILLTSSPLYAQKNITKSLLHRLKEFISHAFSK